MQILLSNTKCYVEDAGKDVLNYLSSNLKYRDPNAWFLPAYRNGFWDGYRKFFDLRSNSCDAGFLPKLVALCDKADINYVIVDTRRYIKRRKLPPWTEWHQFLIHKGISAHEYVSRMQVQAAKAALRNYAYDGIPWFRGVFSIATGGGKTSLMAYLCRVVKKPTLIMLGRLDLLYQTKEVLENLIEEPVGIYGDTIRDPQRVTILMSQTASKIKEQNWFNQFLMKQQMVILDEAHHLQAQKDQSYNEILRRCRNAYFRFGLSATPGRRGDLGDAALTGSFGSVIYSKSSKSLRDVGALADVKCWLFEMDNEEEKGKKLTRPTLKKKLLYENYSRHEKVIQAAKVFKKKKWPCLILVDSPLTHGEMLQDAFKLLIGEDVPLINFKTPQKDRAILLSKLEHRKTPYLIASIGVFGEGINAPNIRALIRAEGGDSSIRSLQVVGRGLRRKDPPNVLYVIDFLDQGHKKIVEDTRKRLNIYKSEEYVVSKIRDAKDITFM